MTTILLVRHGHVEGIKPERFRGREQLALTAQGRAEAAAVARRVAACLEAKLYLHEPNGPLGEDGGSYRARVRHRRCRRPAQISMTSITAPGSSRPSRTPRAENPALFAAWFATPHLVRFPNGESLQDLAARAADVLRLVLARHRDETVVLVGHDSVNRALLLQFLDLAAVILLAHRAEPFLHQRDRHRRGQGFRVIRLNETHHLDQIRDVE